MVCLLQRDPMTQEEVEDLVLKLNKIEVSYVPRMTLCYAHCINTRSVCNSHSATATKCNVHQEVRLHDMRVIVP